jgi:hypothetical protein
MDFALALLTDKKLALSSCHRSPSLKQDRFSLANEVSDRLSMIGKEKNWPQTLAKVHPARKKDRFSLAAGVFRRLSVIG